MANILFNISRGRDVQFAMNVNTNTPANSALTIVLLQANEADDVLDNYTDLSTLLAAAGNTEATFTNYTRKVLTDTDGITVTVNNTTNKVVIDIPDQVYTSAGGTLDNTLTKCLICYDSDTAAGTDSDIIPMYAFDCAATTNGNNLTIQINASGLIEQ